MFEETSKTMCFEWKRLLAINEADNCVTCMR